MDTSQQVAVIPRDKARARSQRQRQRRSIAEKRRIVEETLVPGASVARVARAHGVNANQVFGWRRLYLAGRLGEQKPGIKLLPVRVSESKSAPVVVEHRVADFPQHNPARFTSNCGKRRCGSKAAPIRLWCACCWSACKHDGVAGEHADLDCGGRDRLAPRLHRAECASADEAGAESLLRARVCVSRTARRSDQSSMVRWRRVVFVREAAGARALRVAASHEWHGFSDASAVIDACWKASIGDGRSAPGSRSCRCNLRDSFHNFFRASADENARVHAILRAWR